MSHVLAPTVGRAKTVLPLTLLVLGGAMGGVVLGGLAAVVSTLLTDMPSARLSIGLGISAISIAALLFQPVYRLLPERRCQVRGELLTISSSAGAAAFRWGFELGTAVRTFLVTPAVYALIAIMLILGPRGALVIGGIYGLGRGAVIAGAAWVIARRVASGREGEIAVNLSTKLRIPTAAIVSVALVVVLMAS